MSEIRPGARIKSGFWPEPVRVIFAEEREGLWHVEVVGDRTGRYYGERWLSSEDLKAVEIVGKEGPNFLGQAEAVFLGLEAQRIRLAHQFDPLHGLHVSPIDPLPHQIDAVYFHMLPKARLRFLLADWRTAVFRRARRFRPSRRPAGLDPAAVWSALPGDPHR